ncbi:MAG: hypothetical protein WED09_07315 [Homoserinimonas sp.]
MAIVAEFEVARADLNDEYGVSLWVRKKLTEFTPDEAEALAEELLRAAAQGRALAVEDEGPVLADLRARLSAPAVEGVL